MSSQSSAVGEVPDFQYKDRGFEPLSYGSRYLMLSGWVRFCDTQEQGKGLVGLSSILYSINIVYVI